MPVWYVVPRVGRYKALGPNFVNTTLSADRVLLSHAHATHGASSTPPLHGTGVAATRDPWHPPSIDSRRFRVHRSGRPMDLLVRGGGWIILGCTPFEQEFILARPMTAHQQPRYRSRQAFSAVDDANMTLSANRFVKLWRLDHCRFHHAQVNLACTQYMARNPVATLHRYAERPCPYQTIESARFPRPSSRTLVRAWRFWK